MPGPVLTRHQLVGRHGAAYRLVPDVQDLTSDERAELLRLCDGAIANYTGRRGRKLYEHRRLALGDISGTARYEVLRRAGFPCDLCGISAEERAIEIDHIVPRKHGGTDDLRTCRRSAISATRIREPATLATCVLFVRACGPRRRGAFLSSWAATNHSAERCGVCPVRWPSGNVAARPDHPAPSCGNVFRSARARAARDQSHPSTKCGRRCSLLTKRWRGSTSASTAVRRRGRQSCTATSI